MISTVYSSILIDNTVEIRNIAPFPALSHHSINKHERIQPMNQTIATEPATLSQTLSEIGFEETKHATIEVLIQRKLLERIVNMHRSISEVRIRHSDEEGAHWHFFPVYQTVKTGAKKGKCLLVRSDLHLLRRNLELLLKY